MPFEAIKTRRAVRFAAKRPSARRNIGEGLLPAAPLVAVDQDEKVVVVVVDGLMLTGSPITSDRHEWNKP
jgi:hypothetical protein